MATSALGVTRTGGMKRVVARAHAEVLAEMLDLLKAEGFGIVTQMDVKAIFSAKGVDPDFKPYTILGACAVHCHRVQGNVCMCVLYILTLGATGRALVVTDASPAHWFSPPKAQSPSPQSALRW